MASSGSPAETPEAAPVRRDAAGYGGKHTTLELFGDFVKLADAQGRIGDGGEAGKPPLI